MKKYESPEILLAKYELDESIAALISGTGLDVEDTDKLPFDQLSQEIKKPLLREWFF